MTALVLVVDDLLPNVKLLEAKLLGEYYDVVTARDGFEAIAVAKDKKPDLILLDVMMPGMDGFEACRRMKQDPEISHIPVVMVTALSEPSDRVQGLEAGADDFLTKPIDDTALFARVRSLIRIKVLLDELRLRDQTGLQMGVGQAGDTFTSDVSGSKVLVLDDDVIQARNMIQRLSGSYQVTHVEDPEKLVDTVLAGEFDLIIVSTQLMDADGLRLCTHIKSHETVRNIPILMLVEEDDKRTLFKGLEIGINDYLIVPIDHNEMLARVKTQIRRKRYQDALKSNYKQSISMAITDNLTKLYNRHYLNAHLDNMVAQALPLGKPLSLMILDMDHFKSVNDTYGHDVGDEILRKLAEVIIASVRSADLAARFGGEEFVVLMPDTDTPPAMDVAERLRKNVESMAFPVSHPVGTLHKTVSIGVARLLGPNDTAQALLKRADEALYAAKHGGRNRVVTAEE